jgi:hypothetical protein
MQCGFKELIASLKKSWGEQNELFRNELKANKKININF